MMLATIHRSGGRTTAAGQAQPHVLRLIPTGFEHGALTTASVPINDPAPWLRHPYRDGVLTYVGSRRCHTRNLCCKLVPHMFLSQKADGPRPGAGRHVDRADRPLPTELAAFLGTGAPPVHAGVGSMPPARLQGHRPAQRTTKRISAAMAHMSSWLKIGRAY